MVFYFCAFCLLFYSWIRMHIEKAADPDPHLCFIILIAISAYLIDNQVPVLFSESPGVQLHNSTLTRRVRTTLPPRRRGGVPPRPPSRARARPTEHAGARPTEHVLVVPGLPENIRDSDVQIIRKAVVVPVNRVTVF